MTRARPGRYDLTPALVALAISGLAGLAIARTAAVVLNALGGWL